MAGASVGASVGDEAAATDAIAAGGDWNGPRSTSAQATMTATTTIGIRTLGIVAAVCGGGQYFLATSVPWFERK